MLTNTKLDVKRRGTFALKYILALYIHIRITTIGPWSGHGTRRSPLCQSALPPSPTLQHMKGHVLLMRVFSLIQKSYQNYWIFGCFYWYTTQFAITDTALNHSMTNNVKRRWRRREN